MLLEDRLKQAISYADRYGPLMTVVFINLDGFKLVNDSLNHKAGDELLKVMAERMSQCLRSVAPSCGQAAMNSQTSLYGRPGEGAQVAPAPQRLLPSRNKYTNGKPSVPTTPQRMRHLPTLAGNNGKSKSNAVSVFL